MSAPLTAREPLHVAVVTAGGAGMFCGSCMHDNTFARALIQHGAQVTLIPTYTPIRVDETDTSVHDVFLGGVNVYLEHRFRLWRKLPRLLKGWLDRPFVINLATKFAVSNNAKHLGKLTVDLLAGEEGSQGRAVRELADFLADHVRPDVVVYSNALLAGTVPALRKRFAGPLFCLLQGDDIFLEDLAEPHRTQAVEMISQRAKLFDGFLTHSGFYRDFMSQYLSIPTGKFHLCPLGIDLAGHDGLPAPRANAHPPTIGFFARICPEKGLHNLLDAFRILRRELPDVRLKAGGFLGKRDRRYLRDLVRSARDLAGAFEYVGSPDSRDEKIAFYKSLDVLSVPTDYRECKGLYVLEALANGVPVVQPEHGAFPELIEATGGGVLVRPKDPEDLARGLQAVLTNDERRMQLATIGRERVHEQYGMPVMARHAVGVFEQHVDRTLSLPGSR